MTSTTFDERAAYAARIKDTAVLKSGDKAQLKEELEWYLSQLNARYVANPELVFPSNDEWNRLSDLCSSLAGLVGKTKSGFGELLSAINRIENRYSKLSVSLFVEDILRKFGKLPVPPRTWVYNMLQTCRPEEQPRLEAIYNLLGSPEWRHPLESKPWDNWLEVVALENLPSVDAVLKWRNALPAKSVENGIDDGEFNRALGHLAFMDLLRQQHLWMLKYDRKLEATVAWIFGLNNPGYFEQLRRVVHGSAIPPSNVKTVLNVLQNRSRRKRSYHATKSPSPEGQLG